MSDFAKAHTELAGPFARKVAMNAMHQVALALEALDAARHASGAYAGLTKDEHRDAINRDRKQDLASVLSVVGLEKLTAALRFICGPV